MTTETFGISAEKAICDVFGICYDKDLIHRSDETIILKLKPLIERIFSENTIAKPKEHVGKKAGERGKNSKSPYDFILSDNSTLSVKTNLNSKSSKVCPPEVGQPGKDTFLEYFGHLVENEFSIENKFSNLEFKKVVLNKIDEMIPIYIKHLFDCDYLLWISYDKKLDKYVYSLISDINDIIWEKEKFSFTRDTLETWNESTTVKYDGLSIGEFQVHNNRNSYKFRFNLVNLLSILESHQNAFA